MAKVGIKMEFDYYIFIDYSEDFLGYLIIEKDKIKELISKISKFSHYKNYIAFTIPLIHNSPKYILFI